MSQTGASPVPGPIASPSSVPPPTSTSSLSVGDAACPGEGHQDKETNNSNTSEELPIGLLLKDGRFRANASLFFTHNFFIRGSAKDTAVCVQCSRDNEAGKAKSSKYVSKLETFKTTGGNTSGKQRK